MLKKTKLGAQMSFFDYQANGKSFGSIYTKFGKFYNKNKDSTDGYSGLLPKTKLTKT